MQKLDFIDIGSSKGGSVKYCRNRFGHNGYGIDIDERKVTMARNAGYDVRHMDIFEVEDRAQWCTGLHLIEHLSGRDEAAAIIEKMLEIGDKVYLSFPYFDADCYLMDHGFKLFWSDWTGHPFHVTSLVIHNILTDIGVGYHLEYFGEIMNSHDKAIIPLDAPKDSLGYTDDMDDKEFIEFENVYRETRITIL